MKRLMEAMTALGADIRIDDDGVVLVDTGLKFENDQFSPMFEGDDDDDDDDDGDEPVNPPI